MILVPIHIDFETFNEQTIKGGASRYAQTAEILCLSYSLDECITTKHWLVGEPFPQDLFDAIEEGRIVYAHNATFEINVWRTVMVGKYGWPAITDTQWRCTMAEALAVGLPAGLEKIANGMGLAVQKDMDGRRLMQKMAKPRKPTKKDKSTRHNSPEQFSRLVQYCDQDVRSEVAVFDAVPRLSPREVSVFHYDQRINRRGICIDRDLARSALILWGIHTEELNAELKALTGGKVGTSREVANMVAFLEEQGVECFQGLKKEGVAEYFEQDLTPTARRVLEIRQELALSSISKYESMLRSVEPDNRVRGCLQYHAAQTGRWGGRLIQVQNFPRGVLDESEIEYLIYLVKKLDIKRLKMLMPLGDILSSLLRSAVVAGPGKKLIVCDFNAIEARGLAWSAGETWLLDAFKDNQDPYCGMASDIYARTITKKDKAERFLGKTCVLGCGYSMGAATFQRKLIQDVKTFGMDVDTSSEFCEAVVKSYRTKNSRIVRHWYETENAAVRAVRQGGEHRAGPYTYFVQGDWLYCRMPCGRRIGYYKPILIPGKFDKAQIQYLGVNKTGNLAKQTTYSGKLVENNTQAVCRDVLVDGMSRLEKNGYSVVMHVHDETVCEVDEGFGSVEESEQILSETPGWAKGFPVAAEGFQAKRYKK